VKVEQTEERKFKKFKKKAYLRINSESVTMALSETVGILLLQ